MGHIIRYDKNIISYISHNNTEGTIIEKRKTAAWTKTNKLVPT